MRLDWNTRKLSDKERALAMSVYDKSIPYDSVFLTDGLGPIPGYDNPYTTENMGLFFVHIGPDIYPDATLKKKYNGYGRYDEIFIHEMAHVWQYDKGYNVVLSSFWANTAGEGYSYTLGKAWDDYNVEQQGDIVSDWYVKGMSTSDDRFVFIDKIIRPAIGKWSLKGLKLNNMSFDDLKKS